MVFLRCVPHTLLISLGVAENILRGKHLHIPFTYMCALYLIYLKLLLIGTCHKQTKVLLKILPLRSSVPESPDTKNNSALAFLINHALLVLVKCERAILLSSQTAYVVNCSQ